MWGVMFLKQKHLGVLAARVAVEHLLQGDKLPLQEKNAQPLQAHLEHLLQAMGCLATTSFGYVCCETAEACCQLQPVASSRTQEQWKGLDRVVVSPLVGSKNGIAEVASSPTGLSTKTQQMEAVAIFFFIPCIINNWGPPM